MPFDQKPRRPPSMQSSRKARGLSMCVCQTIKTSM
jgi:hypothetical protein